MPIIATPHIHNGFRFLEGISSLEYADDGSILGIYENEYLADALLYDCVICPGFVNAHCHLELSHLQGIVPQHTGLIPFLEFVNSYRNGMPEQEILMHISCAEKQMLDNGIVAVGDISNAMHSYLQKQKANLRYHTFVECVGIIAANASERFAFSEQVAQLFKGLHATTIVPHAPYSVSAELFSKINTLQNNIPISIHNQESIFEDLLVKSAQGDFVPFLEKITNKQYTAVPKNVSSLAYYAPLLQNIESILLVHNTFTNVQDVQLALQYFKQRFWVYCPNANLYIENTLPEIFDYLHVQNECICLGTDSLASNHQLSIYAEMLTIYKNQKQFDVATLLQWATYNGALALDMKDLGSFEIGKKPGIVIVENWKDRNVMVDNPQIRIITNK
jgi:cytosine/adenosine deaminase-related metal-dependent hydrolase